MEEIYGGDKNISETVFFWNPLRLFRDKAHNSIVSMKESSVFAGLGDAEVVLILAFIGGFYDTAGYLLLDGVFTSSITGNLVVACSSVIRNSGVICRSLVVVSFVLSGALSSLLSIRLRAVNEWATRSVALLQFSLELALMIIVWIVGLYYAEEISNETIDGPRVTLVACLMGAAMGFHNVAAKEAITNCPPTTVMTSTLINVASNFSNSLMYYLACNNVVSLSPYKQLSATASDASAHEDKIKKFRAKYDDFSDKFATTLKPLVAFICGGLIGAAVTTYSGFYFSAIPCFLVGCLLIMILLKDIRERYPPALPVQPTNEVSPRSLNTKGAIVIAEPAIGADFVDRGSVVELSKMPSVVPPQV